MTIFRLHLDGTKPAPYLEFAGFKTDCELSGWLAEVLQLLHS